MTRFIYLALLILAATGCAPAHHLTGAGALPEEFDLSGLPVREGREFERLQEIGRQLRRAAGLADETVTFVLLSDPERVNAAAVDGSRIIVFTGLAARLECDSELALVLAHELSHIMRGHHREEGASAHRQREQELEADRDAIRLLAAAGFDTGAALTIWARLYDVAGDGAGIHPAAAERIEAVRARLRLPEPA